VDGVLHGAMKSTATFMKCKPKTWVRQQLKPGFRVWQYV